MSKQYMHLAICLCFWMHVYAVAINTLPLIECYLFCCVWTMVWTLRMTSTFQPVSIVLKGSLQILSSSLMAKVQGSVKVNKYSKSKEHIDWISIQIRCGLIRWGGTISQNPDYENQYTHAEGRLASRSHVISHQLPWQCCLHWQLDMLCHRVWAAH